MKAFLIGALLLSSGIGSAVAAPPLDLSLTGPDTFIPHRALSAPFTGSLKVGPIGVPNQTVELFVDGQLVATASTTTQGNYAISLPAFTGIYDHEVVAVVAAGTPVETSAELVVEIVRYTLSVTLAGAGTGQVISNPAGIDCPGACTMLIPATSSFQLQGIAGPGSQFDGWSGACMGNGVCTATMDSDTSITATFPLALRTLTTTRAGSGTGTITSTPAGINCGSDCTEVYPLGTIVTLYAAPNPGMIFSGWSGGGCAGTGSCTVTMNASMTVTANFTLGLFTLTVSKLGMGSGTVTSSPGGINCGSSCAASYPGNTTVVLTASAAFLSTFQGWSGACTGTGSCFVTMTSNRSVSATFG